MIDSQTDIRTQMLASEAVPFSMKCVFYREPNLFLFLPVEECDTAKFKEAADNALKQGGVWLGSIALMNKLVEQQPVIEYELAPGAPIEAMERAKLRYRDNLIEAGILEVETAHS